MGELSAVTIRANPYIKLKQLRDSVSPDHETRQLLTSDEVAVIRMNDVLKAMIV